MQRVERVDECSEVDVVAVSDGLVPDYIYIYLYLYLYTYTYIPGASVSNAARRASVPAG